MTLTNSMAPWRKHAVDAIAVAGVVSFWMMLGTSVMPALAQAADYPSRQIQVVVPFPAGGSADYFARSIFNRLGAGHRSPHRDREQGRRRWDHRRKGRYQRSARWLYTACVRGGVGAGPAEPEHAAGLRSIEGPYGDHRDRHGAGGSGGEACRSASRPSPNCWRTPKPIRARSIMQHPAQARSRTSPENC